MWNGAWKKRRNKIHDRYYIYKYILVRRTAAYSIPGSIHIIYQVQVPWCETVPEKKDQIKKRYTKKKGKQSTNRTSYLIFSGSAIYLLTTSGLTWLNVRIICVRTNRQFGYVDQKTKTHPPQADDASTAEAAPGKVGRDVQDEAHRANTTPNGGPHLHRGRLRLKTCSGRNTKIWLVDCWDGSQRWSLINMPKEEENHGNHGKLCASSNSFESTPGMNSIDSICCLWPLLLIA